VRIVAVLPPSLARAIVVLPLPLMKAGGVLPPLLVRAVAVLPLPLAGEGWGEGGGSFGSVKKRK
jgi:hypothetical protein